MFYIHRHAHLAVSSFAQPPPKKAMRSVSSVFGFFDGGGAASFVVTAGFLLFFFVFVSACSKLHLLNGGVASPSFVTASVTVLAFGFGFGFALRCVWTIQDGNRSFLATLGRGSSADSFTVSGQVWRQVRHVRSHVFGERFCGFWMPFLSF